MSIFFGNSTNINNSTYTTPVSSSTDSITTRSGDVSTSLPNGGTLSGEVVAKDGNTVTLKLSNDQTISAKLEGNSDITVGNRMTFEVTKGGNNQTLLRPLFSNLDGSPAVNAALKAAGLPLTDSNITFTSQMMNEGMAVNRNALLDMSRLVASYPTSNPATIVSLKNLDMPITENNINQYDNYQNFKHQIMNDVLNLADGISGMISETGDDLSSIQFAADILDIIASEGDKINENIVEGNVENASINSALNIGNTDVVPSNPDIGPQLTETGNIVVAVENPTIVADDGNEYSGQDSYVATGNQEITGDPGTVNNDFVQNNIRTDVIDQLNDIMQEAGKNLLDSDATDNSIISTVRDLLNEYIELNNNEADIPSSDSLIEAGQQNNAVNSGVAESNQSAYLNVESVRVNESGNTLPSLDILPEEETSKGENVSRDILHKLVELTKSDKFTKIVNDTVKNQMSLSPAEVKSGKIDELYERISRQSSKIVELMNNYDKSSGDVAKSATNIGDNVRFMNTLNEYMNYVQLPLKMAGENAHGELYVYTKKKNLQENDGNFSALLHLDMDHLGPMDIHVSMKEYTNVNTHFYLQNEELLDFIEEHIGELTQRLTEKGYNTSINVSQSANKEQTPITEQFGKEDFTPDMNEHGGIKLCFDVRA